MRKVMLALVGSLVVPGASVAPAETPAVSIELAHDSAREQQARDQLEQLLKQYDLSRWIFTKRIRIDHLLVERGLAE